MVRGASSVAALVLLALCAATVSASGSASDPCRNAVCDTQPTPITCNCNYVPELYTPRSSCCPEYRCAPPPAADAFNCSSTPPPTCPCGQQAEIASFPNEPTGQCCPSYQCVRNVTVNQCDCVTCPEPPPCACPGYEPVPVREPTLRGDDCCAVKYRCKLRDPTEFLGFQLANCSTPEEFYESDQGCGGNCEFSVRVLEEASGKNDICCPTYGCSPLRRPKCCLPDEVAACPPVNASCACPQLTRVVVRPAEPLEGNCCAVTECVDLNNGVTPDCSLFEPICPDTCEEAVTVKRTNPLKGRCCPVRKCKKIRGCKNKAKGASTRSRRRNRRRNRRRRRN